MQQRTRLTAYEEGATFTTCKIGRLRHVNAILHSGARTPSEQDRELEERTEMITDHRLSDIEHGWNYTRMLLDITRERWRPVPMGLSTLSTTWRRHRTPS
jgi:hypothetical protein